MERRDHDKHPLTRLMGHKPCLDGKTLTVEYQPVCYVEKIEMEFNSP